MTLLKRSIITALTSILFALGLFVAPLSAEVISETGDELTAQEQANFEQRRAELEMRRAELDQRRTEFEHAVEEMQKASAEMALINKKIHLAPDIERELTWVSKGNKFISEPSTFIGVVLNQGGANKGLEIVGLTPGGPAADAGLVKGDEVLSVGTTDLLTMPGPERMELFLHELRQIEAGNSVKLTILRNEKPISVSVVPEKRNPAALHTLIRHLRRPATPAMPEGISHLDELSELDKVVFIERSMSAPHGMDEDQQIIVKVEGRDGMVAGLDGVELERHIEMLEKRLENIELNIDMEDFPGVPDMRSFEVIIGQAADNAVFFFDNSMVKGLELASLNPQLGSYFNTEDGVLVLHAAKDNSLNLQSGDVITAVASQEVTKPADVMRNLRFLKDGETVNLEVMRKGQSVSVESQPVDKSLHKVVAPGAAPPATEPQPPPKP